MEESSCSSRGFSSHTNLSFYCPLSQNLICSLLLTSSTEQIDHTFFPALANGWFHFPHLGWPHKCLLLGWSPLFQPVLGLLSFSFCMWHIYKMMSTTEENVITPLKWTMWILDLQPFNLLSTEKPKLQCLLHADYPSGDVKKSMNFSFTLISPSLLCRQSIDTVTWLFPPVEDKSQDFLQPQTVMTASVCPISPSSLHLPLWFHVTIYC